MVVSVSVARGPVSLGSISTDLKDFVSGMAAAVGTSMSEFGASNWG